MATRLCPFCAEEIQEAAIKCKHCGSDLTSSSALKAWKYKKLVFHWRNMDEAGWLNAENTPVAMASQHFWNELYRSLIADLDEEYSKKGWEIVEPHGPGCLTIESTRNAKGQNPVMVGLGAVLTGGFSLISNAIGFYKWWPSSLTLRWRKPDETESEEMIMNVWMDLDNNYEWVQMEIDSSAAK